MDSRLRERLNAISEQIKAVYKAEAAYLTLDAAKHHVLATLRKKSDATSQSGKETDAYASEEWRLFGESMAHAEAEFHKQRHLLDLLNNAYLAEHLSFKIDSEAVKRGAD